MADNIGEIYVEISARMDKLEKQLNDSLEKAKRTGKGIEDAFKNKIISLDNALAQKSIQDLEKSAQRLKEHLEKKISLGAPAYQLEALQNSLNKAERAVVMFKKTAETVPQTINKGNQAVGNMNMTMGQLGFLIGDADMFFVNFRMGMMSVANNVPMVVQGLMQAKQAAESTGKSFSSVLASSLIGPGGVMIGINALMFALNVLPGLFAKSDKAVEDHAQKVKDLADQYKNLSTAEIDHAKNQIYTDLLSGVGDTKAKGKVLVGPSGFAWMGEDNEKVNELIADANTKFQALNSTAANLHNTLLNIFTKDSAQPIYTYRKEVTASIQATRDAITALTRERDNATDDKVRTSLNSKIESLNALVKKLEGDNKAQIKAGEDARKDKEQDLKTYYDQVKWYDADYNQYLSDQLDKEIADLSNTITDKIKLQKYRVDAEKKIQEDFWKWVEENRPGLIERNGLALDDVEVAAPRGRKNDQGIYIPDTTMMPIDSEKVRKQKEQSDSGFKNSMKDFEQYQSAAESFANSLSNGFANAITSGENLGEMFKNLAAQLAGMVIQAVLFKAIMTAFDFGTGGAGSAVGAIASGVSHSLAPSTGGTFSTPQQTSGLNLNSLASEMRGVKSAVQAMNVNMMSQKPIIVKNYLDGKPLAQNTAKYIQQFNKGNIQI